MNIWAPRRGSLERSADRTHCRASVWKQNGNWGQHYQCARNPVCTRVVEGKEYGFCKQHDPEAVKARDEARRQQWKSERKARAREYDREERTRLALAACKAAIQAIANGHNDPSALAAETLTLFPESDQ